MSQIFTTTSNTATVRFTTDNSLNFPGFALYYSTDPIPACGGVLYTDGTIETPDFPAHYPSSAKCRWVITAESDKRIEITFESFQTEPGRDFLTVGLNQTQSKNKYLIPIRFFLFLFFFR